MLLLFVLIHKILSLFSRENSFNWSMNKPRKLQQRIYIRSPSASLHAIHAAQIFWFAIKMYKLFLISNVKVCLQKMKKKKMSKNFYPIQVKKNEHVSWSFINGLECWSPRSLFGVLFNWFWLPYHLISSF